MKIMQLHGYFRLPDDFNGTYSDGIRLLAKSIEKAAKRGGKRIPIELPVAPNEYREACWKEFQKVMDRGGCHMGRGEMQRLSKDRKRWIDMKWWKK
jgi:hypothetical protein